MEPEKFEKLNKAILKKPEQMYRQVSEQIPCQTTTPAPKLFLDKQWKDPVKRRRLLVIVMYFVLLVILGFILTYYCLTSGNQVDQLDQSDQLISDKSPVEPTPSTSTDELIPPEPPEEIPHPEETQEDPSENPYGGPVLVEDPDVSTGDVDEYTPLWETNTSAYTNAKITGGDIDQISNIVGEPEELTMDDITMDDLPLDTSEVHYIDPAMVVRDPETEKLIEESVNSEEFKNISKEYKMERIYG